MKTNIKIYEDLAQESFMIANLEEIDKLYKEDKKYIIYTPETEEEGESGQLNPHLSIEELKFVIQFLSSKPFILGNEKKVYHHTDLAKFFDNKERYQFDAHPKE